MPYGGTTEAEDKKIEKCVIEVMKTGASKDSAIAICKKQIMGEQKMNNDFSLSIPIEKIDEEKRLVFGKVTQEIPDKQGDIVGYEASIKAFTDWLPIGNIREMHSPVAVGKAVEFIPDENNKAIWLKAFVSEGAEDTWKKVKDKTLSMFSIGGGVLKREIVKKGEQSLNFIKDYVLNEVSLVDSGACPTASFSIVKRITNPDEDLLKKETKMTEQDKNEINELIQETFAKSLKSIDEKIAGISKIEKKEEPKDELAKAVGTISKLTETVEKANQTITDLKARLEKVESVAQPIMARASYLVEKSFGHGVSKENLQKQLSEANAELEGLMKLKKDDSERYISENGFQKGSKLLDQIAMIKTAINSKE